MLHDFQGLATTATASLFGETPLPGKIVCWVLASNVENRWGVKFADSGGKEFACWARLEISAWPDRLTIHIEREPKELRSEGSGEMYLGNRRASAKLIAKTSVQLEAFDDSAAPRPTAMPFVDDKRINQSVHGDDFWQTDDDSATQRWQQTFNIRLASGRAHTVRLDREPRTSSFFFTRLSALPVRTQEPTKLENAL